MLARYNDYLWRETQLTLGKMGHYKVNEKEYGIECVSNAFFRESILTVFNNQLLFLFYVCDDGEFVSRSEMQNDYPDNRHTTLLQERLDYHRESLRKLGADKRDTYCIIIISSIGRAIGLEINNFPFAYGPIHFNPFELHCIAVNESKNRGFLPRYISAKSHIHAMTGGLFSELNAVSLYTSNHYSFYLSDDLDIDEANVYIAPGDSVEYISAALAKEDSRLVESYQDGLMAEVVLFDVIQKEKKSFLKRYFG